MKNAILVFDSIGDSLHMELFSEINERLATRVIAADPKSRIPRFDILKDIAVFLADNNVTPESLAKIIFVRGPGRFTAVRTACIVANAFASELSTKLVPVTKEDLFNAKGDFSRLLSAPFSEVSFATPLFDSLPSISQKKN